MNEVYFLCRTCKTYHDAGYRWCALRLEKPGIIHRGQPVSIDAVLQADAYWEGIELENNHGHDLREFREYLLRHKDHDVIYDEDTAWFDCADELDWMDEADRTFHDESPRYLVERLGLTDWAQVVEFINNYPKHRIIPQWWCWDEEREAVKRKFEELVQQQKTLDSPDQ